MAGVSALPSSVVSFILMNFFPPPRKESSVTLKRSQSPEADSTLSHTPGPALKLPDPGPHPLVTLVL